MGTFLVDIILKLQNQQLIQLVPYYKNKNLNQYKVNAA